MPSPPCFSLVSRCTVFPERKSDIKILKLSVSDIPMLSCQYIQKGVLLTSPPYSFDELVDFLKQSLSTTLSYFPPLAGRLTTDPDGHLHITCNNAGVDFLVVKSPNLEILNVLCPGDVPDSVKGFFTFDRTLSYSGHFKPLVAVQITKGCLKISKYPDFCRDTVFNSQAVLKFPPGGPTVTFAADEPLRERILHFSREAILKLKYRANYGCLLTKQTNSEVIGKICNDSWKSVNNEINGKVKNRTDEISSFQSLCAHLWRSVTRARKLDPTKTTTFRMAVNCRHRLDPKLKPYYFGNAIQSIPNYAQAGELLAKDLSWAADLLHKNVMAHNDDTVRRGVADWEMQPRLFPLGNADGASITMGSSPRFPMYDNDFGWGRPLAVRSGRANKFDGKISAFPGREGDGSVDLEVVLARDTMSAVENDPEFMQYVSEMV
ncbi:hypothetical protein F3Y22_tig00111027pilonHSYRG00601 [Hibiscus syriacus]|uniref:BAHD acyltransferase DCR n=1 Tax=Hibiscus syriacus TaxID=106335 RepID=A0A6A2Z692_HIBSY|nr:hypothetical protein F3Y22_tig00111027pilonHSYRG00601 [Hibiscus syriacus]